MKKLMKHEVGNPTIGSCKTNTLKGVTYNEEHGQYCRRIELIIDGPEELTTKNHTTDSIVYNELHFTYSDNAISKILEDLFIELREDLAEYYQ